MPNMMCGHLLHLLCCTKYCIVLLMHCTVLYCTAPYCNVFRGSVLECIVLYCTVPYCTVLFCPALCRPCKICRAPAGQRAPRWCSWAEPRCRTRYRVRGRPNPPRGTFRPAEPHRTEASDALAVSIPSSRKPSTCSLHAGAPIGLAGSSLNPRKPAMHNKWPIKLQYCIVL